MPLHRDYRQSLVREPLDHAVVGALYDTQTAGNASGSLMVAAVDGKAFPVKPGEKAGGGRGVQAVMRFAVFRISAVHTRCRYVLYKVAAESDVEYLKPAAYAENGSLTRRE